jgi:methionyl-tRNA synthetase
LNADDVRYIQFLGKDNIPFHAVSFPATLNGSVQSWKTVDVIKGFHWLLYEGGKFSTSARRGIFTDRALDELPADSWRWWMIANAPESADTDFNVRRFAADVNKDPADVFGNLVNRTVRFAHQTFQGRVPDGGQPGELEAALAAEIDQRTGALRRSHEALEFRRAAAELRGIWALANAYLQQAAPWTVAKSDSARAALATRTALNLVRLSAILAWNVIPTLAEAVLAGFDSKEAVPAWPSEPASSILADKAGQPVSPIGPLVEKITHNEIDRLQQMFGGTGAQN